MLHSENMVGAGLVGRFRCTKGFQLSVTANPGNIQKTQVCISYFSCCLDNNDLRREVFIGSHRLRVQSTLVEQQGTGSLNSPSKNVQKHWGDLEDSNSGFPSSESTAIPPGKAMVQPVWRQTHRLRRWTPEKSWAWSWFHYSHFPLKPEASGDLAFPIPHREFWIILRPSSGHQRDFQPLLHSHQPLSKGSTQSSPKCFKGASLHSQHMTPLPSSKGLGKRRSHRFEGEFLMRWNLRGLWLSLLMWTLQRSQAFSLPWSRVK